LHVHTQRGNRAIKGQTPVAVGGRMGLKGDRGQCGGSGLGAITAVYYLPPPAPWANEAMGQWGNEPMRSPGLPCSVSDIAPLPHWPIAPFHKGTIMHCACLTAAVARPPCAAASNPRGDDRARTRIGG